MANKQPVSDVLHLVNLVHNKRNGTLFALINHQLQNALVDAVDARHKNNLAP